MQQECSCGDSCDPCKECGSPQCECYCGYEMEPEKEKDEDEIDQDWW